MIGGISKRALLVVDSHCATTPSKPITPICTRTSSSAAEVTALSNPIASFRMSGNDATMVANAAFRRDVLSARPYVYVSGVI